jgi:hypothetical protein
VLFLPVAGSPGNLSRFNLNPLIVLDIFAEGRETDSRFFLMSAYSATILQFLQREKTKGSIIFLHPAKNIEGEDRSTVDT